MSFRLQARYLFLTYPQVGDLPVSDLDIKLKEKGALKFVIGIEQHEDGGTHFHALVDMGKKINWINPKCLDLGLLHGNYQAAVHPVKVLDYVTKGSVFVFYGWKDIAEARDDVAKAGTKRCADWDLIGDAIISGKSAKAIVTEKPGRFKDVQRIEEAIAINALWNMPTKPPFQGVLAMDATSATIAITQWLNDNIQKERAFKAPQLYVYGDKNLGKTSLINLLSEHLNVFYAPNDSEWMDDYSDDFDLVVFDEFRAQYTIQWLNRFLEGSCMPLKRRSRAPVLKKKNMPVVILSNFSLQEAYAKSSAEKLETLEARLAIIHATQFLKIGLLMENSVPSPASPICTESPLLTPNGMRISGETATSSPGTEDMMLASEPANITNVSRIDLD